jgi:hypothetical protein
MVAPNQELMAALSKIFAIAAITSLAWGGDREIKLFVLGGLIGWLSQDRIGQSGGVTPRTNYLPFPDRYAPDPSSRPNDYSDRPVPVQRPVSGASPSGHQL